MENTLFRKQSIDSISSPEDLHDYLRVTGPKMWMLLTVILAMLTGLIIFSASATIENTLPVKVDVGVYENSPEMVEAGEPPYFNYISGTLPLEMIDTIRVGMKVRIAGREGRIYYISTAYNDQDGTVASELYYYVELDDGFLPGPEAEWDAEIVLESASPISYLWGET